MSGFALALLHLFAGVGAQAGESPADRPLRAGTHDLAAGEVHTYAVRLEAGQFVRLTAVQDGVDVAAVLVTPEGQRTEVDTVADSFGREPLSVLAVTSGTYRVEVRPGSASPSGRYAIESEEPRPADEQDRVRIRAERALAEAAALLGQNTPDSNARAFDRFEASLQDWRTLDDQVWELETLLQRGAAYGMRSRFPEELEAGHAILARAHELGDRRGEARAQFLIAQSQNNLLDYDASALAFEEAVELRRALGDVAGEADLLGRLAWVQSRRGEPRRRVELTLRALELRRRLGDRVWEGWALMDLGAAYTGTGEYQEVLERWREAHALFRAAGDLEGEALATQRLGFVYQNLGDYRSAIVASQDALALFRDNKNSDGQLSAYITMASAYRSLGDTSKALEFFGEGLRIARETGARVRQAQALTRIGATLAAEKRYDAALPQLEEALRLTAEVKDTANEAATLMILGRMRLDTGQIDEARASFARARELYRLGGQTDDPNVLYWMGRAAREKGDLAEALAHVEAAIQEIESVRKRLASPEFRSTYVASSRDSYELYVDVLMGLDARQPGQGFAARALQAAEAARARGFLDRLAEAGQQIRQGVDSALLDEERAIQDRLSAALDRQLRVSQGPHTAAQEQAAARAVQTLSTEWGAVRERIRTKSPRFSALRDPAPTGVSEIRADVLDAETVLLEYALGEKRSFLWALSRDGLATFELPARADIERAARAAYARLVEPSRPAAPGDALGALSRMVLGPAARSLGAKRLLIVPDGALHYVPFAALPDPNGAGEPLIARHEIVGAPSSSVVALLRQETAGRRPAPRTLAVLADPVFAREDERLGARPAGAPLPAAPAGDTLASALRSAGVNGGLPRLPFTRREASAILALVPPAERLQALDFDASRATATDPSLADYRLVHFATHGFLNSSSPDLSGIVLSLVGRDGADARGFLTATDVFNLHLNADLVVLSGCRTALGEELRGEGLIGLSRGFMYAGAPRVVASLWRVDDAATAELMKRFYRGILKEKRSAGAALRAAQLDLMRRPRFRHPFYWSAFQLQGEWR